MSASSPLVTVTERGLYCPPGNFYIDPWQPVQTAVVTHGHGDHLAGGSGRYIVARPGLPIARVRVPDAVLDPVEYRQCFTLGDVRVSLHPAGHVLGSAQIRIEHGGAVWVVSGDYKRAPDPTCEPFEPVTCDVFVSEATFALPVYRWEPTAQVIADILEWWRANRDRGLASVLFCYALGKSQRVLAELAVLELPGPIYVHGALQAINEVYRQAGIALAPTEPATVERRVDFRGALVLAPPSAAGSPWMRRFRDHASGFCSGWMRVRGNRRRRGYDRGFVLSDHADWPALLETCRQSAARRVLLTHGHADALTRYLNETGIAAAALETRYGAEN